jgi:hypothetical protein
MIVHNVFIGMPEVKRGVQRQATCGLHLSPNMPESCGP